MNVNDDVWVRLTDYGERLWAATGVPDSIRKAQTEADGRIRFQLWDLMLTFGQAMYMGNGAVPFKHDRVDLPSSHPEDSKAKPMTEEMWHAGFRYDNVGEDFICACADGQHREQVSPDRIIEDHRLVARYAEALQIISALRVASASQRVAREALSQATVRTPL